MCVFARFSRPTQKLTDYSYQRLILSFIQMSLYHKHVTFSLEINVQFR